MLTAANAALVAALERSRLLTPAQLADVRSALQRRPGDAQTLFQDLIRQGWLTSYQAKQIVKGHAADLVLGNYALLEPIGAGAAGQVFKARHQKMGRLVALKVLRADLTKDGEAVQRFYREIEVASQLAHPNIVHAYEAGPLGPLLILVMEFVNGLDLQQLVQKSGPLAVPLACEYIRQAAIGLQYAHEKGLVHRDIKPSNLLLARSGERGSTSDEDRSAFRAPSSVLVKILDLGLARLVQPGHGSRSANLTVMAGNSVMQGTPDYMAPEQALDFHRADIRADIYSLGCTFFYLLAGRPPFAGGTLTEKLMKHQTVAPAIAGMRPDLPPVLEDVLGKMLAKRPANRYQFPAEVAAALQPFCPAPGSTALQMGTGQEDTRSSSVFQLPVTLLEKLVRRQTVMRTDAPHRSRRRALLLLGSAAGVLFLGALLLVWSLVGRSGSDDSALAAGKSATRATIQTNPGSVAIRMTVDDQFELFVNGVRVGSGNSWKQLDSFTVPLRLGSNVIAVKAHNNGGPAGLLAELSINGKRFLSGPSWKVNAANPAGWDTPDFDDRAWLPAADLGPYGSGGWQSQVAGLPTSAAHWIWLNPTRENQTVYFRCAFSTTEPVVASYAEQFQPVRPAAGWKYLWNQKGPIGNPAGYAPLTWDGNDRYNVDGGKELPRPGPGASLYLGRTAGHPGSGTAQGVPHDFCAIAAYTIQTEDGAGSYRITNSSISKGSRVRLIVHVNDQAPLLNRAIPSNAPPTSFDTDLHTLKPGETVYVAVGPDGDHSNDTFSLDFRIRRGPPPDLAERPRWGRAEFAAPVAAAAVHPTGQTGARP